MANDIDVNAWAAAFSEAAERHLVPGAQLGILRDADAPATVLTHGVTRHSAGNPVRTDSLFQIGSITKVWTATVVMMLIDERLLSLDTLITDIVPEWRNAEASAQTEMTVRHLLTHTNGIDGDVFIDTGRGDDVLARYVEALGDAKMAHPIGETWSYSNSGYILLGRVIEKAAGGVWDQILKDRIITPLGLAYTSTLPEDALLHDTAIGHVVGLPEPVEAPIWSMARSAGPAGLINSTAGDVLEFARMHLRAGLGPGDERILTAESAQAMASHQVELPDVHTLGDSWGLGWIRYDWSGSRLIGHDGATVGQNAFFRLVPETGSAIVLLANGGQAGDLFDDIAPRLLAEVAGVGAPARFAPLADSSEAAKSAENRLGDYARTYRGPSMEVTAFEGEQGPWIRISLLGELEKIDPEPVQDYQLSPTEGASDVYAIRFRGSLGWQAVTFFRIGTGRAYLHFGGRALPAVDE